MNIPALKIFLQNWYIVYLINLGHLFPLVGHVDFFSVLNLGIKMYIYSPVPMLIFLGRLDS